MKPLDVGIVPGVRFRGSLPFDLTVLAGPGRGMVHEEVERAVKEECRRHELGEKPETGEEGWRK